MELLLDIYPSLLNGLKTTIIIFLIVIFISLSLGFIIAIVRVNAHSFIQKLIDIFIFVMRGTPLMLQIMFIFFGLPFIGITLDRFVATIVAFSLNYSAYFAEILRGGLNAVPTSQFEAIKILNIKPFRAYKRIIIPQVFKIVLPSITNETISLVKDTSLIYIIGLNELLKSGQTAVNTYATIVPFIYVAFIYLIVIAILTYFFKYVERRLI